MCTYFQQHMANSSCDAVSALYAKFDQPSSKLVFKAAEQPLPAKASTPFNTGAYYSEHFAMSSSGLAGLHAKFSKATPKPTKAVIEAPLPAKTTTPFNAGAYYSEHFALPSSGLAGLYAKFSQSPPTAEKSTPAPAALTATSNVPAALSAAAALGPSPLEPSALASHRPAPLLELSSSPLGSSPKTVPRTKRKVINDLASSPESKMSLLSRLEADPLPTPKSPAKLGQLKELQRNSSVTRLRGNSPAGPLRPRLKESITAFRMDLDDEIEEVPKSSPLKRQSSFTKAFDALGGAEFHHMASDSDSETTVRRPAAHAKSLGPLIVPATPKTRSNPTASAMAMDLGFGETSRGEFLRAATPGRGMPARPLMPKSSSLGTLHSVVKSKPAHGLLPQLSATNLGKPKNSHLSSKGTRMWGGAASSLVLEWVRLAAGGLRGLPAGVQVTDSSMEVTS
eukprot:CAMPEP_0115192546 /NCGR_PEP_ID=MMETSP0270-20121206/13097_1 /TAXON_ID=71861 /ORGANISM="Scrippsiella trochoidea, Strain CCMP3099" /LENGTH=451 /DNA_ID=CAMNT_0002605793 /DNA_START=822 /DNA_END=2178 /DNA_ORIENTATION=-